jgi:hypothetical protein
MRNTRRTLMSASGVFTAEARADKVAIDASDAMDRTLAKHYAASGGFVTSTASSNPHVHWMQWRPLTHRRTHPVSENHL